MSSVITVSGDHKLKLQDVNPSNTNGMEREDAEAKIAVLGKQLTDLNELQYEANTQGLLIVLQGMDTSGKDGTIRCLLDYANAQGTHVVPFKVPTEIESSHDFLWRVHLRTPGKGEITIFNRSHYEDVLIARVHELADERTIEQRYKQINAFEQLLSDSGVIILKFFLHIDKDEQKERLLAREEDPEKSWKLSMADWQERQYWDDYQKAYELAINNCSSSIAPWHIVPANHKWSRNYAILHTIVHHLQPFGEIWQGQLEERGKRALAELKAYRANNATP